MVGRLAEFWIWLCASMACAGWFLSAFSLLGGPGFLVLDLLTLAGFVAAVRRFDPRKLDLRPEVKKLARRFRRWPAFLFLLLWVFSAVGAMANPTIHFDSLSYRLPRILHWLAEGRWHWIHTPDTRMNVIANSTEWVWAQLMVATDSERMLCWVNLISFAFLPGLLSAFFIRVGVRRRLAWWWMWLLPAGYCYAFQAGSLATDSFSTIFALGAVVYSFKAADHKNPYYLWTSILALGFATGVKQTNLLVVPLWFLPFLSSWRVLLRRPVAAAVICLVAALASYLPMCMANIKYAGTWKGFKVEPTPAVWAIAGNLFALPIETVLPPFFPGARRWNARMDEFVETPFGAHFRNFEQFAHLYRGPSEHFGGLGLTTFLMVVLGFASRKSRRELAAVFPPTKRWAEIGILIMPWLLVFVFMASITITKSARYLAFFYPFMLAGPLALCDRPWRFRWWRVAGCVSLITTLLTLAVLRQRPLFPVNLTTGIVAKMGAPDLARKAREAFHWVREVRAAIDAYHAALPPETRIAGYVSEVGNLEGALWHPYGSRRVWRFSGQDPPEALRRKGVEYAIVDHTALESSGAVTIENWLARYNADLIFASGIPPEPGFPPKPAYLVKLK